jgi:ABC-type sugar transport system permease subunit
MNSLAGGKRMLLKKNNYQDRIAYLLIAPFYFLFIYFILIPIIQVIVYSFTDFNLFSGMEYAGLRNYQKILTDETFHLSVKNTLINTVFTIVPSMVLGLLVAVLLNVKLVNTKIARTFVFMPYAVSMVAVSMIWMLIYDPTYGVLNQLLKLIGLAPKQWLMDPAWALPSIIIMSVWKSIGYNMIIFLAALQGIPKDYYEAAEVDGANRRRQFLSITLPLLAPATFFLFVTGIIHSFNVFEQVNVMTGGGPINSTTTIVHQIYLRAFQEFKMGYASAQAITLLLGVLVITLINMKLGGSKSKGELE